MGLADPDRQQRWDAIMGGLRTIMALSAMALVVALAYQF